MSNSESNPKRRSLGVVDTTPHRLPPEPRRIFIEFCLDPVLTVREIRRRMIAEGFRMNLATIEKAAARIRHEHGLPRPAGRPSATARAPAKQTRYLTESRRIEEIAQAQALALSVTLGATLARDVVARMSEILGISGGPR